MLWRKNDRHGVGSAAGACCGGIAVMTGMAAGLVPAGPGRRSPVGLVLLGVVCVLPLILWQGSAHAGDNVAIDSVRVELDDEVLYLNAAVKYRLTPPMVDALHEGVPLTMLLSIEIVRRRDWWPDDVEARLEQRYRLEYNALTRQYLLTNLNSGSQFRFPSLEAAISVLGTVVHLPLLDRNLLREDASYYGRLQIRLDEEALPVPLRLLSYLSADWHMKSEWYTWRMDF